MDMQRTIEEISSSFLSEAEASPRMLADLASMERYMAESYNGRTLIELIQNADDAGSTRFVAHLRDESFIVANDGRPFSESDILAISRSGASRKERGESIGYRGVGFKSATTISSEIVILSGGACFSFSKSECARRIGVPEKDVPTVRVPFSYDLSRLPIPSLEIIDKLKNSGFTTFFVFPNADKAKVADELSDFNSGWLLFLKNIIEVDASCGPILKRSKLKRQALSDAESILTVEPEGTSWYVVANRTASIAFKYSREAGIVACEASEAVFHCFMPTLDKTGFPFKVNADFSTDPSRKHIILDSSTDVALVNLQHLMLTFLSSISKRRSIELYPAAALLGVKTTLSSLSSKFEAGIFELLRKEPWVPGAQNEIVRPSEIRIRPKWLSSDEWEAISALLTTNPSRTLDKAFGKQLGSSGSLLARLGAQEESPASLAAAMGEPDTSKSIPNDIAAKLFAHCLHLLGSDSTLVLDFLIPLENGRLRLRDLSPSSTLAPDFREAALALLTNADTAHLSIICDDFSPNPNSSAPKGAAKASIGTASIGGPAGPLSVSRWKTPVQNCLAIEARAGRNAKRSPAKQAEYDIVSLDRGGGKFYIAVKSVSHIGDSFRLSEAQYNAASQFGEQYLVYLFAEMEGDVTWERIADPTRCARSSKIIKEWEWVLDSYALSEGQSRNDLEGVTPPIEMHETRRAVNIDGMSGTEFERFCARLLINNGYKDVQLTKESGDQGIDIIAFRDGIKFGIQCKRYSSPIGNDAIQEAIAGRTFYGCNVAVVMANNEFTPAARQLAESGNIVLWNRSMLKTLAGEQLLGR